MLYICERCWTFFEKKCLYERHLGRKTLCAIRCRYCNIVFNNKESVNYHIENKVCRNFKVYYCGKCHTSYRFIKNYENHMKIKHPPPPTISNGGPTAEELFA